MLCVGNGNSSNGNSRAALAVDECLRSRLVVAGVASSLKYDAYRDRRSSSAAGLLTLLRVRRGIEFSGTPVCWNWEERCLWDYLSMPCDAYSLHVDCVMPVADANPIYLAKGGLNLCLRRSAFLPAVSLADTQVIMQGRRTSAADVMRSWGMTGRSHEVGCLLLVEPIAKLVLAGLWKSWVLLARWPLKFPSLGLPPRRLEDLKQKHMLESRAERKTHSCLCNLLTLMSSRGNRPLLKDLLATQESYVTRRHR